LSSQPTGKLTGKVVAITGGGQGIGAATAQALVTAGARVAIGDIDLATAQATAKRIGGGAVAIRLDVTDPKSFDAFLDEAEAQLGPLDVLVNNAGIMPLAPLLEETDELTARVLEINVRAMIYGTREAVRRMLPRGGGHVINIASTAGKAGLPGGAIYCASKAAMLTFSEAVHGEYHGTGIKISCVMPGIVRTHLADGVKETKGISAITPEQVADAIVQAVAKPRFEVYVPKSYGTLFKATSFLPRPAGEWLGRKMGADKVFMDAWDKPERKAYEDRARGN
jgi:NAD(P)-dependent dehydrogenase (short-subunit alcohol dehydrogenase family)